MGVEIGPNYAVTFDATLDAVSRQISALEELDLIQSELEVKQLFAFLYRKAVLLSELGGREPDGSTDPWPSWQEAYTTLLGEGP